MKNDGHCVILGVTGGIAAYKAADLCSKLTASGLDVHVVMTENAKKLVSERLFLTLSRNRVTSDIWSAPTWEPEHVELSERAELMVVAPATADFLGKYANGIADDALTTTAIAFSGKMILAPAMNPRMWNNPAVRENCRRLADRGVEFCGPETGRLACGTEGVGRMAEPAEILKAVLAFFRGK